MSQDEVLICVECRVEAQVEGVDGQIDRITCPSCAVSVEGDSGLEMALKQLSHDTIREFQERLKRTFGKGGPVSYSPGRLNNPRSPFIVGIPDS